MPTGFGAGSVYGQYPPLANALLDTYTGTYEIRPDFRVEISREATQLIATFQGVKFVLFAESPTKFFAKTTDVQCEFKSGDKGTLLILSVGEGGFEAKKIQ